MKIRVPQSLKATVGESGRTLSQGSAPAIEFTEEAPNQWVALVNVTFPNSGKDGDTRAPEVTVPIRLITETSLTSKGVRRVLFKAAMPYQSLAAKDDVLTTPVEPNLSRSGGEISVHTVMTLNAAAAKDRTGANGSIAKRGCVAQTQLLAAVLHAVLGSLATFSANPDSTGGTISYLSIDDPAFNGGSTVDEAEDSMAPVFVGANPRPLIPVTGDQACGLTVNLQGLAIEQCLRSILERGLSGLSPIEPNASVAVATIIHPDNA